MFRYGEFLNALIAFGTIAAVVFFFVVKPVNHLLERLRTEASDDAHRKCPECISEIPKEAVRCAFCGVKVKPAD